VFGLQPERAGFTVVEVSGSRPVGLARADGSALFSPTLPGGVAARLFSLVGAEELLELGWRLVGVGSQESGVGNPDSLLATRDSRLPTPDS
jgi:hypothetical protein